MPHKKEKEMEGRREGGCREHGKLWRGEKFHPVEIDLIQKEQN